MTPDEIEAEREQFEAWWTKDGCDFQRDEDGEYTSGPTWCLWRGWLAAIASERARRKQEQAAAEALLKMQGWPEMEHMQEKWESGE